jgi:uncharacterized phiE125 gp8 family phage protein
MGKAMIEVLEAPADPIVSLAEMKQHLRVDHTDDDQLIEAYTSAASARVDGPASITGRTFRPTRLRASFHSFGSKICLPYPPIINVIGLTYLDSNGDEQTFAETDQWRVIGLNTTLGAEIVPLYGVEWPSLLTTTDGDLVRVEYLAGYQSLNSPGDNAIPKEIAQAVKLIVADWYDFRPSSVVGTIAAPTPHGAEVLLAPYRVASAYLAA